MRTTNEPSGGHASSRTPDPGSPSALFTFGFGRRNLSETGERRLGKGGVVAKWMLMMGDDDEDVPGTRYRELT